MAEQSEKCLTSQGANGVWGAIFLCFQAVLYKEGPTVLNIRI